MATPEEITVPVHAELERFSGLGAEAEKPAEHVVTFEDETPAAVTYLLPEGWKAHHVDLSSVRLGEERPRRPEGTAVVESAADLVKLATIRRLPDYEPVLIGDEPALRIVAVLNDPQQGKPAWGDYRVVAQLRRTHEWRAWIDGQGLHPQEEFAQFVEDHLEDISAPPAADMLELAQTFQAHTSARFQRASMLASGRVSITYDEDQDVKAGTTGQIEIPREFEIVVKPFVGSAPYRVRARLRYRVGRGDLQLGWVLNQVDAVERQAFDAELTVAADGLEVEAIRGSA